MNKSIARLFCILFFFYYAFTIQYLFADDSQVKSSERVSIQLRWYHQFQFAGFYAAKEKGFYQEKGLDVELIEGAPGIESVTEVVAGRADFGVGGPNFILSRNAEMAVIVLAVIFQRSPIIILARADSGIETLQDLVGRKLMIRLMDDRQVLLMFLNEGIPLNKVTFIEHTWNYNDLLNGDVDAATASLTVQPNVFIQNNIPYVTISPATYGIDFYGDCFFTTKEQIKKYPERVKAFREASLEGWTYALSHPEEIIDIIIEKYAPDIPRIQLEFEAEKMEKLIMPDIIEVGHMNPVRWEYMAETQIELGQLDADYIFDGLLYDSDPTPDYKWIRWTLGGLIGALFIILIVLFIFYSFNKRLKMEVFKHTLVLSEEIKERKKIEVVLKLVNKKLNKVSNQRQNLAKQIIELFEQNRQSIAAELHDQIGQTLTSCKIDLELINKENLHLNEKNNSRFKTLTGKVMQALQDVKRISQGLRPAVLDTLGLESSLLELTAELQEQTNLDIKLFCYDITKNKNNTKNNEQYPLFQ